MTSQKKVIESSIVENAEPADLNLANNGGLGTDSVLVNDLNESINKVNSLDLVKHPSSEEIFTIKNGVK
jgi:hypothetical protein